MILKETPVESKVLRGLVIRTQSGFYTVKSESSILTCQLRGRLKIGRQYENAVAVGDWVKVTRSNQAAGMIEAVEPRTRMFSRMAPNPKGEFQQIIIANPDQVVLVFSCSNPEPRLGMLDRYLIISEKQRVPPLIVVNKVDLVKPHKIEALFSHYAPLGYTVIPTSAISGEGLLELKTRLLNKISLLTGPSGVGKSSLLNAIQPGLGLIVRQVSQATNKGKHTTVVREMFPLQDGGYVADTPGLKALALWDVEPEELDGYFPEMRLLVQRCKYSNCTHLNEPDCAILSAVNSGQINPIRYRSYCHMRSGESD
jgi:ribosome biogenesis GTPase